MKKASKEDSHPSKLIGTVYLMGRETHILYAVIGGLSGGRYQENGGEESGYGVRKAHREEVALAERGNGGKGNVLPD